MLHSRKELCAGALMALVGAGAVAEGMRLDIGVLTHMGPGFFPVVLGVLLIILGLLIASASAQQAGLEEAVHFDLRGASAILAGVLAFLILGKAFGFLAATFAAVLISALGDRTARLRASLMLAGGVAVVGAVVFTWLLAIPFPLLHWF
jgi:hypothetical protein